MVLLCCCQCDPRLATYGVSIMSFLHFLLESVLLFMLDDEHRLVDEDKGVKFMTVFVTNVFLVLCSIILFFAALYLIRLLCIPWLIGCAFHLLIYLSMLVIIMLRLFDDFTIVECEKFFFTLFQMFTISYGMWIVTVFMMQLKEAEDNPKPRLRANKSVFKLYSETETEREDEETLFPKQSRSRKGRYDDKEPLLY